MSFPQPIRGSHARDMNEQQRAPLAGRVFQPESQLPACRRPSEWGRALPPTKSPLSHSAPPRCALALEVRGQMREWGCLADRVRNTPNKRRSHCGPEVVAPVPSADYEEQRQGPSIYCGRVCQLTRASSTRTGAPQCNACHLFRVLPFAVQLPSASVRKML